MMEGSKHFWKLKWSILQLNVCGSFEDMHACDSFSIILPSMILQRAAYHVHFSCGLICRQSMPHRHQSSVGIDYKTYSKSLSGSLQWLTIVKPNPTCKQIAPH